MRMLRMQAPWDGVSAAVEGYLEEIESDATTV